MKRLYFAIMLALALHTLGGAQPYQSIFHSDTTKWTGYSCIIDAHEVLVAITCRDTIINDNKYKVVEQYNICNPSRKWIDGFLREDTLTGRVWLKSSYDGYEQLIMDLTLKAGDAFNDLLVDSVYYSESRKVISIYHPFKCFKDDKEEFIEGIGPTGGIPFSSGLLLFKYNNSERVYTSPSLGVAGNDPYLCHTSVEYINASGLANILYIGNNQVGIKIYEGNTDILLTAINTIGQVLHTQRLTQGDNLVQLPGRGIHFFNVRSRQGVATFKLYLH